MTQRYSLQNGADGPEAIPDPNGEYVRYEDTLKVCYRCHQPLRDSTPICACDPRSSNDSVS